MSTVKLMFIRGFLALVVIATMVGMTGVASAHEGHDHDAEASCWISASPSHVYEGGSVTLTWGSSDADNAWIDGLGDVSLAGSRTVYDIDEDTTFKLTVENDEGTASCETEVEVTNYNNSNNSGKTPGCTIYRENTSGNGVTLRWNTTNASSAYLSNVGSVSTYGMYTVYPTYDTTYVLTVYGNGQSRQCQIEIDRNYGTYHPTQYTNYGNQYGYNYGYPYISLTQIPYTGVDLGTVGTAVYFLALAMFAVAGGYLLAYYNGGVLRFSFAQEVKAAMRNQARSIRNILSK
jgi:hypothetical protein